MDMTLLKNGLMRTASTVAFVVLGMGALSQQAVAGIQDTKHNLSANSTATNKFSGTGEICVFCHTPHGSDTSASVPLWNRTMANPSTYTTYNSLGTSSLDGATAPVGSVSLACLSCHDGTQAMSVLINEPGSGKVVSTFSTDGAWTGSNQTGGAINNTLITYIGTDLKNDHPVGIQYAGGPKSGNTIPTTEGATYNTFADADFKAATTVVLNNQPVWYVNSNGTAGRQKTDIQLYTRTDADKVTYAADGTRQVASKGIAGAQPFVECASCHDPHNSDNATFLRMANTNSAVCLACHTK